MAVISLSIQHNYSYISVCMYNVCVCVCFCLHISLLTYTSAESICFPCTGLTAGMERHRLRELCALFSKFLLEPNSVSSTFWATLATHWSHSYSSFQHLQRYFSGEFCHCKGLKKTHEHIQVHCFHHTALLRSFLQSLRSEGFWMSFSVRVKRNLCGLSQQCSL